MTTTSKCLLAALVMQFDDILKDIGEFGKYQKIKYFLLCFVGVTLAFQALASVFTIYTPSHRYVYVIIYIVNAVVIQKDDNASSRHL